MKKHLVVLFLFAAGLATAAAQDNTFRAPQNTRPSERAQRQAPVQTRGVIGAFPRAARGNPLQLINPRAPRRYFGSPRDTVTTEPYFNRDRYSGSVVTGLILVGVVW